MSHFTIPSLLTEAQVQQYQRDGYLVVAGLLSDAEVATFLSEQQKPKPKEWQLGLRSHLADPQYRYLAYHPKIAGMAAQLLQGPPKIVQTMFLNKASAGGTGIALHQDSHYLPNEPLSLMACWLALCDTDEGNGGLCVVPGSHQQGLRPAVKNSNPEQVIWEREQEMRTRDGRDYKQLIYSFQVADLDPASIVRLSVPKGAGVFFTGLTVHGSYANKSTTRPRPAFATHYVHQDTWVLRCDVQQTVPVW
jgi:phytanoyl-CoA hydroxylase